MNKPDESQEIVQCPHCHRYMLTTPAMKSICRECFEKLNRAKDINEEYEKYLDEEEVWKADERKLWMEKKVG